MVNCPKCGTPNPDSATLCLACSAPLEGQKFAQALDRAQQSSGSWPAVQVPSGSASADAHAPMPSPAAHSMISSETPGLGGQHETPGLGGQHEVTAYMAQAETRKRRKRVMIVISAAVALAASALFLHSDSVRKRRRQAAAKFMAAFMDVDSGKMADYWRCVVGSKRGDVHRAKDNLVVTSGLERAFRARPERHAGDIRTRCMPMLEVAAGQLDDLKPPPDFADPLTSFKRQVQQMKTAIQAAAAKMDMATELAERENDVIQAAQAFHSGHDSGGLAVGYVRLLSCAIPRLSTKLRRIRSAPDAQPVVEHIYASCQSNPSYADTLRKKCVKQLDNQRKTRLYALAARRMRGDPRDVDAIRHCFKTANRELFSEEFGAVGKSWVEYRNAVKKLVGRVSAYKDDEHQTPAASATPDDVNE